jgi:site-specific recombinase XerD
LQRLFAAAPAGKPRALLMTTYGGGVRVSEVVRLQVTAIDSQRRMIRVTCGKRTKGRDTLRSERLRAELRADWTIDKPRPWLVPGRDAPRPLTDAMARLVFNPAKATAGLHQHGSIHALRHGCATHLLEARVALRTIQVLMGHASITTTAYYLQLTRKTLDRTQNPLDLLDLSSLSAFAEVPPCQPSGTPPRRPRRPTPRPPWRSRISSGCMAPPTATATRCRWGLCG